MFQAPKLTNAGKALYYENMGGVGIKFTTIQMGKGTLSGSIANLTALVDPVVTMDATVTNNQNQYCDISGKFSNADLTEGFYWQEIGVFAADPDYPDDRSHDILYCYQNAFDTADFIPVSSVQTVEKRIVVPVIVGDAENVNCTISRSLIFVSLQDLEDHNEDVNAHKAILDIIDETQKNGTDALTAHNTSPNSHADIRELIQNVHDEFGNYYTKPETDDLVSGAVSAHNTDEAAHPYILHQLVDRTARIKMLEDFLYNDITGNPHSITFVTLDGLVVTGVWNEEQARLEC